MSRPIEALGGPVLGWDVKRATRRKLWWFLLFAYWAWLVIQAGTLFRVVLAASQPVPREQSSYLLIHRLMNAQRIAFLDGYLVTLLEVQLVVVLALVPALTAGSLGVEKERGTLFALFETQLTSRQIVLGKLFGRLALIVPMMLIALPALVFIAAMTDRGLTVLVLALTQEVILAAALGTVCLLFAIWIRRAADAIIACYLFLALVYLTHLGFTTSQPAMFWLDPIENLLNLLHGESLYVFLMHLAIWAFLGWMCLRLGWGRLRQVCVAQIDKKPPRRLWAFRPPVGNNPIRWRECYLIGLAPIPILRIVPRWLALLTIFLLSAAVAAYTANDIAPGFVAAVLNIDPIAASQGMALRHREIQDSVQRMGLIFVLLADLLVGVRCAMSVAEEKRRNTWDDLLLTAQSFREITTGKMWGILQATFPYVVAIALPVFFLAWLGGPRAVFTAAMWIILPSAIVYIAALLGIDMLRVPPDMDETRLDGAFWFEKHGGLAPPCRLGPMSLPSIVRSERLWKKWGQSLKATAPKRKGLPLFFRTL
jgi:ABC-type transport system involved in multi-copper enzyme maturation permease subunit